MAVIIEQLGLSPYQETYQKMQSYSENRHAESPDKLLVLEHPRVFTLGKHAKKEHVLAPGDIDVIACDRGGQVSYHGPGQLVIYTLIDLKRNKLGAKQWVEMLESAIILLLSRYGITGQTICKRPGVYVGEQKIAAIGLRIKHGCCYHGISLNVAMDLAPFKQINPCGYADLSCIDMRTLCKEVTMEKVKVELAEIIRDTLKEHT